MSWLIVAAVVGLLMTALTAWVFDPIVDLVRAHPQAALVFPRSGGLVGRVLIRMLAPLVLAPGSLWMAFRGWRWMRQTWPAEPLGPRRLLNLTRAMLLDLILMPRAAHFPLAAQDISEAGYEHFVPWLVPLLKKLVEPEVADDSEDSTPLSP